MYQASADFLSELKQNARFEHIRGTIGGSAFTDANIVSMSYSNRCSDTKDISFGLAYVGQLNCCLVDLTIPRGSFKNLPIVVEFGLTLPDETIEYIPVGTFYVAEALWTDTGINITANDAMSKFDKAYGAMQTSGTVYDFLSLACQKCGVSLGMSAMDCNALPNGTEVLGVFPDNDIKTYRDFIGWIAQTVGGFATIDRNGALVVRSWADSASVDTFTVADRIQGSSFSDYETSYGGISIVNIDAKTTQYYGDQNGAVINLGSNPLLQYGTDSTKTRQRTALATIAQGIEWTPFTCSVISNLVYDLGDLITMTGGVAGTGSLTCCIMAISWSIKQLTTFRGYGADPSLSSGKSRTDKELSGLLAKTNANEMIIYSYENAQAYSLPDSTEVEVVNIKFATVNPKTVNLWHEIDLDVEAIDPTEPVTCIAHYYLDGEELSYNPTTTWDNDGEHLLHLLYYLDTLEGGQRYDWVVKLEIQNGTATIATDNVHAVLQGQGLVATDAWTGEVTVNDPTFRLHMHGHTTFRFTDNVVSMVEYRKPNDPDYDGQHTFVVVPEISDASFRLHMHGKTTFRYTDNVNILTEQGVYIRTLENGDTRVTEDDKTRITEGG